MRLDEDLGCCEPAGEAVYVGGYYVCPEGTRMGSCGVDEPACGAGGCPEIPTPPCYRWVPDRGCCDERDRREQVCVEEGWSCPSGYRTEAECSASSVPPLPPEPRCVEMTTASSCLAHGSCEPIFEDACCPECSGGPCTPCVVTSYRFAKCVQQEIACGRSGPDCGTLIDGACGDRGPDCSAAVPAGDGWCSVPGCVEALPSRSVDCPPGGCEPVCVPLTAQSCGPTLCDRTPPPCPPGKVPLVVDGCFGAEPRCIDALVCRDVPGGGGSGGFCGA